MQQFHIVPWKSIWRFHTKKIQRYGTFCDKCEQLMQLISPNGYYIAQILVFFLKQKLLYPPTITKTKKPKPNSNDQKQYWPLICSGVWMQALEKFSTLNDRDTAISSLFGLHCVFSMLSSEEVLQLRLTINGNNWQ